MLHLTFCSFNCPDRIWNDTVTRPVLQFRSCIAKMLLNDAPKNYRIRRPCSDPLLTNLSISSSAVISLSTFVKQKSWIHKPLKFFTSGNPAYFWAYFERDRTGCWVRHSRESVMHKTIIKSQCEFSPLFFPSKSNFIPASLKENSNHKFREETHL